MSSGVTTIFVGGIQEHVSDAEVYRCLANLNMYVGKITRFVSRHFAFCDVVSFTEIPYGEHYSLRICKYAPKQFITPQESRGQQQQSNESRLLELEAEITTLRENIERQSVDLRHAIITLRNDIQKVTEGIEKLSCIDGDMEASFSLKLLDEQCDSSNNFNGKPASASPVNATPRIDPPPRPVLEDTTIRKSLVAKEPILKDASTLDMLPSSKLSTEGGADSQESEDSMLRLRRQICQL